MFICHIGEEKKVDRWYSELGEEVGEDAASPAAWFSLFCVISRNFSCRCIDISAQRCSIQWAVLIAVWFVILKSGSQWKFPSEGQWLRSTQWNPMPPWKIVKERNIYDKKRWPEYSFKNKSSIHTVSCNFYLKQKR